MTGHKQTNRVDAVIVRYRLNKQIIAFKGTESVEPPVTNLAAFITVVQPELPIVIRLPCEVALKYSRLEAEIGKLPGQSCF